MKKIKRKKKPRPKPEVEYERHKKQQMKLRRKILDKGQPQTYPKIERFNKYKEKKLQADVKLRMKYKVILMRKIKEIKEKIC